MHIHGHSMAVNETNFYSAAQGRRAEQTQRAAETRKKLLKSVSAIDGAETPEESLLIGQWMGSGHSQVQSPFDEQDEYSAGASGRDSDFD